MNAALGQLRRYCHSRIPVLEDCKPQAQKFSGYLREGFSKALSPGTGLQELYVAVEEIGELYRAAHAFARTGFGKFHFQRQEMLLDETLLGLVDHAMQRSRREYDVTIELGEQALRRILQERFEGELESRQEATGMIVRISQGREIFTDTDRSYYIHGDVAYPKEIVDSALWEESKILIESGEFELRHILHERFQGTSRSREKAFERLLKISKGTKIFNGKCYLYEGIPYPAYPIDRALIGEEWIKV